MRGASGSRVPIALLSRSTSDVTQRRLDGHVTCDGVVSQLTSALSCTDCCFIQTCSICRLLDQACRFPRIQEDNVISTVPAKPLIPHTRAYTGETDNSFGSCFCPSPRLSIYHDADCADGMGSSTMGPWHSLQSARCHGIIRIYRLIALILRCSGRFVLLLCHSTVTLSPT